MQLSGGNILSQHRGIGWVFGDYFPAHTNIVILPWPKVTLPLPPWLPCFGLKLPCLLYNLTLPLPLRLPYLGPMLPYFHYNGYPTFATMVTLLWPKVILPLPP